jgi:tRNA:m(5)U-54 methyltransferase
MEERPPLAGVWRLGHSEALLDAHAASTHRPGMTGKPAIVAIHIIGGGLAGSEAAWQIAETGLPVVLHEMRPARMTDAHQTDGLAELVCSNSFRSDDASTNAVGLLHQEMRRLGSLVMRAGDQNQVPAGGALAVDRLGFSGAVSQAIAGHPLISVAREEIDGLPPAEWDEVISQAKAPLRFSMRSRPSCTATRST